MKVLVLIQDCTIKIINGRIEFYYDNSGGFGNLDSRLGLNDYDYMKYIQFFLVQSSFSGNSFLQNFLNCTTATDTVIKEIVFLSKLPCTTYNLCRLRLHDVNYIECCTDGSYPSGITLEGSWFKDVKFESTCGWKCCETVYTIRCIPNISEGTSKKEIVSIVTNDYAPHPCPSTPTGTNCTTSQPVPCSAGCNN